MTAPVYSLSIDTDSDMPMHWLSGLSYCESLDALDMVSVELAPDTSADIKAVLKKVRAGAAYELSLGTRKLPGDLVRVSTMARSPGTYQIAALGLEQLHRLRHQRLSEVAVVSKDKVASAIIQKAGLTPKAQGVGATAAEAIFLDDPMLATLKRLADERNFALRSNGKTLEFTPRNAPAAGAALSLSWQVDTFGLSIHQDLSEVVTAVTVFGRDHRKGVEIVKYEAKEADLKKISGGDTAVGIRGKLSAAPIFVNETIRCATASEVKERAVAILAAAAETFTTGTLRCALRLDARAGQKVSITDAPWPLGGPFLIHSVTHTLAPAAAQGTEIQVFSDGIAKP